jgi:hypothetical protein
VRLQMAERTRELALFNLRIDSKLRACDPAVFQDSRYLRRDRIAARMRAATQNAAASSVRDHVAGPGGVETWIRKAKLRPGDYPLPSRIHQSAHIGTCRYARIRFGCIECVPFAAGRPDFLDPAVIED